MLLTTGLLAVLVVAGVKGDDPNYLPYPQACKNLPKDSGLSPNMSRRSLSCVRELLVLNAQRLNAAVILRALPRAMGKRASELRPQLEQLSHHWSHRIRFQALRVLAEVDGRGPPEAKCIDVDEDMAGSLSALPDDLVDINIGPGARVSLVSGGEWGSMLTVLVEGETVFTSRHSFMHPRHVVQGPGGWFVIESLEHMSGFGAVSWLSRDSHGKWSLRRLAETASFIDGWRLDEDRLIVRSREADDGTPRNTTCTSVISVGSAGDVRVLERR